MTTTTTTLTSAPEAVLSKLNLNVAPSSQNDSKTRKVTGRPGPDYKYAKFLPSYDHSLKLPPLEPFEHVDPGHAALNDPEPRSFLKSADVKNLSPALGSEVDGIQLSQLDAKAKSQLALYVAQRGVVAFRNQDFVDQTPEWQLREWGQTFGRIHIHPTSGQPAGYPEFHLVYKDDVSGKWSYNPNKLSTSGWHSDVTYELQPPGLTTLFLYENPASGGDTAFLSQTAAYNKLSPSFREYLETLSVVHSGVEQAEFSRAGNRGGVVKREPVENIHPLVRKHPVTGEKALFINRQFSRRIVGLKSEESEAILNLLYTHLAQGLDFQVRVNWAPKTVVLWDNRITCHSAIGDYDASRDGFRHGARITPQAERPSL